MRTLLTALTCLMTAAAATGQSVSADPRTDALARLLQPVTAEFDDAALEDIVTYIEQVTGVTLEPVWDDDAAGGLDRDAFVTMTATGQPILSVLERVLDKVDDEFDAATWQCTPEGTVEIGPRSALNRRAYVRIYDVRDLTFVIPDFTDVPDLELGQIVQGQGGSSQDVDLDTPGEESEAERLQQLIDLVKSSVEYDQWRANGGDGASLSVYRGSLLVRAPAYIHRQIGGVSYWPTDAQVRRAAP